MNALQTSVEWMRRLLGPQHLCFADVGAARGVPNHLAVLGEVADLLLFEPHPTEARALEERYRAEGGARKVSVYPCALSGSGGMRTLHVTNTPTGSSLLRPSPRHGQDIGDESYFFPMRELEIQTRTLASVLSESGVKTLDFIKLDTQGADLEILEGLGAEYLDGLTGVEVEIGMPGGYEEQPGFSAVDAFLRSHQLELFDIKPARSHRSRGGNAAYYPVEVFGVHADSPALVKRVWEVDAIYFRSPTQMLEAGDVPALRRLAALMCVYGLFQEAFYVAETAAETRSVPSVEAKAMQESIRAWHRATEYCVLYKPWVFPRANRLKRAFRRLLCGRRRDRWGLMS